MTTRLDVVRACQTHMETSFEEGFRRYPDDPYRAISWMLHHESSMPNRRADYFLKQLEPLRKKLVPTPADAPPPVNVLRQVLGTLLQPLALLSPAYADAVKLATEHKLTAVHLLEYRKQAARGT